MQQQWDVLVIGGGPGGLSAAAAAAENGLEVLLLDDQESAGGQIYRSVSSARSAQTFLQQEDRHEGLALIERFAKSGAEYRPNTTVWQAEQGRVLCSTEGVSEEIRTQCIVVATGAMERPVPFAGWTLPGVLTAGAADLLYKSSGLLPHGPVVIAGNGPLIPLVANHLVELGVSVAGVLNTGPLKNTLAAMLHMPGALRDVPFLCKGLAMVKKLLLSGVPMYRNSKCLTACGDNALEKVVFTAGGKTRTLPASTLLVHEGVIPRTHVSRMLHLTHAWSSTQRYWYPVGDAFGHSSTDKVYVVGDGAGVHGAAASVCKGLLAGIDAARRLKVLSPAQARLQYMPVKKRLDKALAPRAFVDSFFAPRADLFAVDDDVLVCRCEGVTAGDIRQAVREGCLEVNEIKLRTRCGMGPCQGRMCGSALAEIAAAAQGRPAADVGALHIRPPVRPVTLRELSSFS